MSALRLLAILAMLALLSFYLWRRLVRDTRLRGAWRWLATLAIVGLQLPMLIANLRASTGPPMINGPVAWPAFLGWALIGLTFAGLLIVDSLRLLLFLVRRLVRHSAPLSPHRPAYRASIR